MKIYSTLFVLLSLLILTGCSCDKRLHMQVFAFQDLDTINYPYEADSKRKKKILTNHTKLKLGMTHIEVVNLLGKPDELSYIRPPKKPNAPICGSEFHYLIKKNVKHGSINERQQVSLLVYFDLNGCLVATKGSYEEFNKHRLPENFF